MRAGGGGPTPRWRSVRGARTRGRWRGTETVLILTHYLITPHRGALRGLALRLRPPQRRHAFRSHAHRTRRQPIRFSTTAISSRLNLSETRLHECKLFRRDHCGEKEFARGGEPKGSVSRVDNEIARQRNTPGNALRCHHSVFQQFAHGY